jgi:nicotinamidase-related amidase
LALLTLAWHFPEMKWVMFHEDRKTVVASSHKLYGPEAKDPSLQLRKRGITKVILAGMFANVWVEAHLRELLEQGV